MRMCSQFDKEILNRNWVGILYLFCVAFSGCDNSASIPEQQAVEQSENEGTNNQPVNETVVAVSPEQTVASPEPVAEVKKLSITELWKQVRDDSEVASREYAGKTLEVTGRVLYMKAVQGRNAEIVMFPVEESERNDSEFYTLVGFFTTSDQPWNEVLPGQMVTLETHWSKLSKSGFYENCQIKSVSGEPPGEYTAEELADQYEMLKEPDLYKDEFIQKFKSEHVVVTGKVKSLECDEKGDFCKVKFETSHKTSLEATFESISRTAPQGLNVGQTVRFVGSFDGALSGKRSIRLEYCLPLEIQ